METAFFKFANDKNYDTKKVYDSSISLVLTSSLVCIALLGVFYKQVAAFTVGVENTRYIFYFIAIMFLDAIAAVPFAKLRHEGRAWKFSLIKIANSLITIGFNLFFFLGLPKINALSSYYQSSYFLDYTFIANLIGSTLVFLLLFKEVVGFKFTINKDFFKSLLRFSWPLVIVGIAGATNQFADRILIEKYEDSFEAAGLFSGAIKIAVIMNLFVTAFNYASEPFFFKNSSETSRKSLYGSIALAFTICGMLIFLGVMYYIDIFKFIIDPKYWEALYVVPFALMANFILGLYYNVSIWYKLSGKTIYGAFIAIIGSIVFLSSSYFLIPSKGIVGASYSSILCFSVMVVIAYLLGQKHYPIKYPVFKILGYIAAAIAIFYITDILAWQGIEKAIFGSIIMLGFIIAAYFLDFRKIRSVV
jgi:O-antigen/teichoic acid export membrane protein